MELAENDHSVKKRLADLNVIPKDRKISNVILENNTLKEQFDVLKYENEKLRDQLDQASK